MRRIKWEVLEGWSVKSPEEDDGTNALKIYMPYGLQEYVLLPGDDTLIPTGLWFQGLYRDFIIIPIHHTYPNKRSDVMDMWNGKLREDTPILHMSIVVDRSQIYVHVINLGDTELKFKPGNRIAYFCFARLFNVGDDGFSDGEEDLAGFND